MKWIGVFLIIALPCAATLFGQPQQSENFLITKSVLDAGGAASSSEDFKIYSAFGQPTPVGRQSSESFQLWAGYLSPMFAISPLSPIQALVILTDQPNILLSWERIGSANSYKIYRDTSATFTPGPTNYLDSVSDTSFTDVTAISLPPTKHYYIVTASSEQLPATTRVSRTDEVPEVRRIKHK